MHLRVGGGCHREWRRGGTPSWYDEGNKSRAGGVKVSRRQVRAQRRCKKVLARETGETAVWKYKGTEKISVNKYRVLKEHIWELQRILDGKQASLRKTYKNQAEANDKSLVSEREYGEGHGAVGYVL